jgi:hypothetical protein
MPSGGARKRAALSLEERLQIVEWATRDKLSQTKIVAKIFNEMGKTVSQACISNVLKHKEKLRERTNLKSMRDRKAKWPGLEQALLAWLDQVRAAKMLPPSLGLI